jgi:hypothetical protein
LCEFWFIVEQQGMTTTTNRENEQKHTYRRAHTYIYIIERRNKPTYMSRREESICMHDRHTECLRENTNEYALNDYQESVQYVMYLGILELTYTLIYYLTKENR